MNLEIAPNSTFRYSGNISHFQADGMAQKGIAGYEYVGERYETQT